MSEPSLIAWLQEPNADPTPFEERGPWLPENPSKLNVLASLIALNGGRLNVTGWGCHSSGGLLGRVGLSQDEALTMIAFMGFVNGWLEGTGGREAPQLQELLRGEFVRMESLQPQDPPP